MASPLGLTIKSKLQDMQIGDCIPCRYTASTGNTVGNFSELGICTASEIPVAAATTPNGLFYFIKATKDLFVADRVIQSSISWDTLNSGGFVSGKTNCISEVPFLTANTFGSIKVSASSTFGAPYPVYYAFNSNIGDYWFSAETNNAWLKVDFGAKKTISSAKLLTYGTTRYQIKNFRIEGSDDDVNWSTLYTGVGPNTISTWITCKFNRPVEYRYYRVFILDCFISDYIVLQKMVLIGSEHTVRLLTGGTSATDKENEWDKIVAESTLNSKITAGNNSVWNWSGISSWTSTVGSTGSNRVIRGNATASTYNNTTASTTSSATIGFRPIMYVENTALIKYLLESNSNLYTTDGTTVTQVGTAPATSSIFTTNGMSDLTKVNNTVVGQLSDTFKVLMYKG